MKSPHLLRNAGWLLVAFYLLAIPGISPLAIGLLSAAGEHHAHEIQIAAAGDHFDLVLHHTHEDEADEARSQPASAPSLVLGEDDDHHADHVFQFQSSGPNQPNAVAKLFAAQGLFHVISWSEGPAAAWTYASKYGMRRARPPPQAPPLVKCLRTTVLLV